METIVDRLLACKVDIATTARHEAFEKGNPYYALFKEDGGFYRKELPNGETYLVTVKILFDEKDHIAGIQDHIMRKVC